MTLEEFLNKLQQQPEQVTFSETMAIIDRYYQFTPGAFRNGTLNNAAGENNGSCKLFAFARRHGLSELQTLHCFGDYYRDDVLTSPDGDDHRNIRQFMQSGWDGIVYRDEVLQALASSQAS